LRDSEETVKPRGIIIMIIQSKPSNDNYRQNYDGIFRKKYPMEKRCCYRLTDGTQCNILIEVIEVDYPNGITSGLCPEHQKLWNKQIAEEMKEWER